MLTTEYEIYAFILGSAAGSIVTYYNMTRDRRAIRAVREGIDYLGGALGERKVITDLQWKETEYSRYRETQQFISDKQILENYRWAAQWVKRPLRNRKQRQPHPATLAALNIICNEFLGLDYGDAIQALAGAKTLDQVVDRLIERKAAPKGDA
jgi:hypothetical protein